MTINPTRPSLLCFSHLRWNFVYQRPQHLMSRWASERRVFYVEEPYLGATTSKLEVERCASGVVVCTPHVRAGENPITCQRQLLNALLAQEKIQRPLLWYYTPMALPFSRHVPASAIVYDCMDQLSAFRNPPPGLLVHEQTLLRMANVVFTGGHSLYEAKRDAHPRVHAMPSSVDVAHFRAARGVVAEPADQGDIPHPRLGFFGVLDERFDIDLIAGLAARRPDWHIVLLGPIVKIDPATLPWAPNIHYLGQKPYHALPSYLAHWDVAMMPFARNEATRYISPTKTPEYLAAGKPVVSTSITDVVRPYGVHGLVRIADSVDDFERAVATALVEAPAPRMAAADAFLHMQSWDRTWAQMKSLTLASVEIVA